MMATNESETDLLRTVHKDAVRIVRCKHRVGFKTGSSVQHVINTLEDIPREAEIDEIILHDIPGISAQIVTIAFHEERLE